MKYLVILFMLFFVGCSCKPQQVEVIKTVKVEVPIKCVPKQCDKPQLFDYSDRNVSILERAKKKAINDINKGAYSECLEASVKSCE